MAKNVRNVANLLYSVGSGMPLPIVGTRQIKHNLSTKQFLQKPHRK